MMIPFIPTNNYNDDATISSYLDGSYRLTRAEIEKNTIFIPDISLIEKGDKVQVLDRSALKRTIDSWGEHYWYQIKRESDGVEQRQLKSILSASLCSIFK